MGPKQVFKSRRPYVLLVSFAVGVGFANRLDWQTILALSVFAFYFVYPASLWMNGVDHMYKADVESLRSLFVKMLLWNVPFALVFTIDNWPIEMKAAMVAFLVLSLLYGLRLKGLAGKIFGAMGGLSYAMPAVFAYALLEAEWPGITLAIVIAVYTVIIIAYDYVSKK